MINLKKREQLYLKISPVNNFIFEVMYIIHMIYYIIRLFRRRIEIYCIGICIHIHIRDGEKTIIRKIYLNTNIIIIFFFSVNSNETITIIF